MERARRGTGGDRTLENRCAAQDSRRAGDRSLPGASRPSPADPNPLWSCVDFGG
ncbi:MAG: hypothetical protein KatS3mg005_4108 [Bryobacteraceae bacterium]|nr:MAG: hypothetical protein KatS3mg005_4108 [Bryobacteraceae bacterium]